MLLKDRRDGQWVEVSYWFSNAPLSHSLYLFLSLCLKSTPAKRQIVLFVVIQFHFVSERLILCQKNE